MIESKPMRDKAAIGGGAPPSSFLEDITRQNFFRLSWFLAVLIVVNVVMTLVGDNLEGVRRFLPRSGQWPDIFISPFLLVALGFFSRAPLGVRVRFVTVAVAVEALASAWYFYLSLPTYGPTAVFALTIVSMGVLILVSPGLFATIIIAALALHLGLALESGASIPVKVLTVTHGVVAAVISCLAQSFLYAGKRHDYGMDVVLMEEAGALRAAINEMELHCRDLEESTTFAAHDLKSPLESLVALLRLASQRKEWKAEPHASLLRESISTCAGLLDLGGRMMTDYQRGHSTADLGGPARDLRDTLTGVTEHLQAKADSKRILIAADFPVTPCLAVFDSAILRSVIETLLDNAISYSPEGSSVSISLRPGGDCWEINISDKGPGIPKDERGRLFHPFFQASNRPYVGHPGNGLGLFIAARRISALGGTLEYVEDGADGSIFQVCLPFS